MGMRGGIKSMMYVSTLNIKKENKQINPKLSRRQV
jgi:hypothetical protein